MEKQFVFEPTSPLLPFWQLAMEEGRLDDAVKLEAREAFRMSLLLGLKDVQDFTLDSPSVRLVHHQTLKRKLYVHSDFSCTSAEMELQSYRNGGETQHS